MRLFRSNKSPGNTSGPIGQGTRVASPGQGTLNGPKLPPTAAQYGGNESVPNTQHTVTQERGWPNNPATPILPGSGTREMVLTTSAELHTLPAPPRILRQMFARVKGYNGAEMINGFPYNADMSTIPHRFVPRTAQRVGPPARGIDDNAVIPAVYAGNPR